MLLLIVGDAICVVLATLVTPGSDAIRSSSCRKASSRASGVVNVAVGSSTRPVRKAGRVEA